MLPASHASFPLAAPTSFLIPKYAPTPAAAAIVIGLVAKAPTEASREDPPAADPAAAVPPPIAVGDAPASPAPSVAPVDAAPPAAAAVPPPSPRAAAGCGHANLSDAVSVMHFSTIPDARSSGRSP